MPFTFAASYAASVSISVIDAVGRPVVDVAVMAQPEVAAESGTATPSVAVMDQANQQFVPYVLAVRTGTPVVFPNSDEVAHQVYSFSSPKRFELGLYRGQQHQPVLFDKPGVVVLGCNIHDNMIGYIYVTDAPHVGKTDSQGRWRTESLPPGRYTISAWSPRLARREAELSRQITLADGQDLIVKFKLSHQLRPAPATGRDPRLKEY